MINFWSDNEDDQGYCAAGSINVEHPMKLTRIVIRFLLSKNKEGINTLCEQSKWVEE